MLEMKMRMPIVPWYKLVKPITAKVHCGAVVMLLVGLMFSRVGHGAARPAPEAINLLPASC